MTENKFKRGDIVEIPARKCRGICLTDEYVFNAKISPVVNVYWMKQGSMGSRIVVKMAAWILTKVTKND